MNSPPSGGESSILRHAPRVTRVLSRILGGDAEVVDQAQEVMLRALPLSLFLLLRGSTPNSPAPRDPLPPQVPSALSASLKDGVFLFEDGTSVLLAVGGEGQVLERSDLGGRVRLARGKMRMRTSRRLALRSSTLLVTAVASDPATPTPAPTPPVVDRILGPALLPPASSPSFMLRLSPTVLFGTQSPPSAHLTAERGLSRR